MEKSPGSHLQLWRDFTANIFQALNKKEFLIWILLGKSSQSFDNLISIKHGVISAPHPAAEIYSGGTAGFFGSRVFTKCNEVLNSKDLSEITW